MGSNLTSVVHNLISGLRRFDYAYNNVSDVTVARRDSGNGDGYKYDLIQQITDYYQNGTVDLVNGTISNPTVSTDLTFDGCGNRRTLNAAQLSTPNALNQPTDTGISYAISGNQATWNGNLQVYSGWNYSYDAQNRLRSATKGTTTVAFYYDGLNRQCARSINNVATFSVWDGDWAILEEYGSGNVVTEKRLLRWGAFGCGRRIPSAGICVSESSFVCRACSWIAQKSFDLGHFIGLGLGVPLFPIDDRQLIAADDLRHVDLQESQIEPSFANGFADCSWLSWIAFYFRKVWTDGATNPTKYLL